MKFLTIFPAIVLEYQDWLNGERVPSDSFVDDFSFCGDRVFSYRQYLKDNRIVHDGMQLELTRVTETIVDQNGEPAADFTSILSETETTRDQNFQSSAETFLLYNFFERYGELNRSRTKITILMFDFGGIDTRHTYGYSLFDGKYRYLVTNDGPGYYRVRIRKDQNILLARSIEELKTQGDPYFARIVTALNLFNQACIDSKTSLNAATLLMVSALEALLEIPPQAKIDTFSYAIKVFWGFDNRLLEWAKEIYRVRSGIVHGETIDEKKLRASEYHHYPHFQIARKKFPDCVLLVFERKMLLGIDSDYKRRIHQEVKSLVIPNVEKMRKILNRKKDFTFEAMKSNKLLYREFIELCDSMTLTDYSGRDFEIPVLKQICRILTDWVADLRALLPTKARNAEWKEHLEMSYTRIEKIAGEILANRQLKDLPQIHSELRELSKTIYEAEGISGPREKVYFELSEMSDKVLRKLYFGSA